MNRPVDPRRPPALAVAGLALIALTCLALRILID